MTKTTLAMLLGAACASAWWAAARWAHDLNSDLYDPAILLSIGVIMWLIFESGNANAA